METDDFFLDLVQKRIERQEMIRESETPVIWAIITQSVIRDLERDPEILAGQVDHLIDLMDQGRVLLQVVPAAVRFRDHPGLDGAFSLVSLPDQQEVVYVEGPVSGSMVTDPGMVERMSLKFGGLQSVALPRMKHESSSRRFEKRSMDTRNWHKSSYSNGDGGNCVEAYEAPQTVKVRDTQHRHLGHLTFTTTE